MDKEIPVRHNGEIVGYTTDGGKSIRFNDSESSKKVNDMLTQNQTIFISSRKDDNVVEDKSYESDIEKFILWKDTNRWFNFSDGKWNYTFEQGTSISKENYEKDYRKTTKELIEIWESQIKLKQ